MIDSERDYFLGEIDRLKRKNDFLAQQLVRCRWPTPTAVELDNLKKQVFKLKAELSRLKQK